MMSSVPKGAFAPSIFKWHWRDKSSLTTQLLNDEPPEIELSEYRRLSSAGSESPSGLLNDEGLKSETIADLDLFFERLYNYYREKGLLCIVIKWIVELLTVIFVTTFIWFFLLVVDWHALRNVKCGMEAVESGQKPCDLAKEAINHHPLVPLTFSKIVIVGSMVILIIYGLFNFLKFFVQFTNTLKVRHFYYQNLNVTDREIQTTPWPTILEKVVQLQKLHQLCVVKDLSAHEVVMRIMRKENYLIGMLNKGVLAFPIRHWVPGAGPTVNSRANGRRNRLILPKTLEWTLNWCIFNSMFDSKFCIQRDFITNPSLLRKRLVVVGIGMFLLSPCLVIFMLVYLFLRHAEQFYNHPSIASSRRWSNLSRWIFREFNEVDHLFKHRMNNSVVHASDYLKQFPSPLISIIAKFISFVSGGFAAILIIIAFLDESLLEGHIFGRNLFWYAAVFGTVTALSRAAVADELQVLDPQGAMSLVCQQTHYMPRKWRGKENCDSVRQEFETLFQYTGMMLLEEMASILVTPYLLIFVVPKRVDDILRFISDFTVDIEGVGHVCSFSAFNFESHGNKKYGSPFDAPRETRSSQGKMEKSFLSFQSAYPSWEPSIHGRKFLATLCKFKDQQVQQNLHRHNYPSPSQPWELAQSSRTQSEMFHRYPPKDILLNIVNIPDQDGIHQPYILDLYYTSSKDCTPLSQETKPFEPIMDQLWAKETDGNIVAGGEVWGSSNIPERLQSHLEASTSSPLLKDGSSHPCDPALGNPWWARSGPHSSAHVASFLEPPPVFGHRNASYHSENASERSWGEQEADDGRARDWRNRSSMSRTNYMDDDDGLDHDDDGFDLHFADDIERNVGGSSGFGNPLVSLPVKILPRSNDPVQ
ncbi:autophagy-related protein 9 isoform X2 [Asparagus officinalis]|uniref:autophagy-related protein 9 isoform X2 n=1 Tax=Asparagus officinalis TaxID=4686 RepID=UPI00098E0098|nr:autophagy-related protein 9 isoform X2 [Asparagus officinalis]